MNEEMANKFLTFEVDEIYAVEISKVLEIIEYQAVTRIPETPDYITGVTNIRGKVIPVIDLRLRFKKKLNYDAERRCVVIVDFEGLRLGIAVDKVVDLVTIDPGMINDPPQVGNDYSHVFVKAIGVHEGAMKLILDSDKLINYSDLEFIPSQGEETGGNHGE